MANNSKQSTGPKPAAEQNQTRRTKKDHQNAIARARAVHKRQQAGADQSNTGHTTGSTLIDGIRQDRQQRRAKRESDQHEQALQREAKALSFRKEQAAMAKETPAITSLTNLSLQVALAIIEAFPTAEPYMRNGRKVSRTAAAIENMRQGLSAQDAARKAAVEIGIGAACRALSGAYNRLTTPNTKVVA